MSIDNDNDDNDDDGNNKDYYGNTNGDDANYVNVILRLGSRLWFGLLELMLQCLPLVLSSVWRSRVDAMLCFALTAIFDRSAFSS